MPSSPQEAPKRAEVNLRCAAGVPLNTSSTSTVYSIGSALPITGPLVGSSMPVSVPVTTTSASVTCLPIDDLTQLHASAGPVCAKTVKAAAIDVTAISRVALMVSAM